MRIKSLAAVFVSLLVTASCSSDETESRAQEETNPDEHPATELARQYNQLIHVDPGFDLSDGSTTIEMLASESEHVGVGYAVGARDDLSIVHGPDDVERLLVFEVSRTEAEQPEVFLVVPGASQLDTTELSSSLRESPVEVFYLGEPLELNGSRLQGGGSTPPDGQYLTVPHGFPLFVEIGDASGVAVSLTSDSEIPDTDENLAPLRRHGVEVDRLESAALDAN